MATNIQKLLVLLIYLLILAPKLAVSAPCQTGNFDENCTQFGYFDGHEVATPTLAPMANHIFIYPQRDPADGKLKLWIKDSTVNPPSSVGGDTGPEGPEGPEGPQGATGTEGPQGATGTQGPPGEDGEDGADSTVPGPIGPQGATGTTGPQGATGTQGPIGATGPQGATGTQGEVGPPGPPADQGLNQDLQIRDLVGYATGNTGAIHITGPVNTLGQCFTTTNNSVDGSYITVTENCIFQASVSLGASDKQTNFGLVKNPTIAELDMDFSSIPSSKWLCNADNFGAAFVSSVCTASFKAVIGDKIYIIADKGKVFSNNTLDLHKTYFSVLGFQSGVNGIQGIQGEIGPKGATGTTGATGPQGATGTTGPQGATGTQGIQGIQGPIGATGTTGPIGATGTQGIQGPAGQNTYVLPAAFAIDWSSGQVFYKEVSTTPITFTYSGTPANGMSIQLVVKNTGAAPITINLPAGLWLDGTVITNLPLGATNIYTITRANGVYHIAIVDNLR